MTDEALSRSALLLGAEAISALRSARVAVFGVGGVGSFAAEALARCGIGRLTLVDGDVVAESNINRQLVASYETIGQPKVEVMRRRILSVNLDARVETNILFYSAETADELPLDDYDYVVDAIDTVASKLLLIERAARAGAPIISSMGAGNKLDPTRFEVADISKTSVCPLARVVRTALRKRGIHSLKVVYSKEPPIRSSRPPGSVSFVPSVAGLILAGEVVKDMISTFCGDRPHTS